MASVLQSLEVRVILHHIAVPFLML